MHKDKVEVKHSYTLTTHYNLKTGREGLVVQLRLHIIRERDSH